MVHLSRIVTGSGALFVIVIPFIIADKFFGAAGVLGLTAGLGGLLTIYTLGYVIIDEIRRKKQ